jgi:hypothetical protein
MRLGGGALKQMGARILGFQNFGSSKLFAQDRAPIQTKPFLAFSGDRIARDFENENLGMRRD